MYATCCLFSVCPATEGCIAVSSLLRSEFLSRAPEHTSWERSDEKLRNWAKYKLACQGVKYHQE